MVTNESGEDATHFRDRLPAEATNDFKAAFAAHWLASYRRQEWKSDSLTTFFAEDCCNFSEDDFKEIDCSTRRNLRDLPRNRGVFVPKVRSICIAVAL